MHVYQGPSDSVLNIIHDSLARSRFPSCFVSRLFWSDVFWKRTLRVKLTWNSQLSRICCLKMRTAGYFNSRSVEMLWKRETPNQLANKWLSKNESAGLSSPWFFLDVFCVSPQSACSVMSCSHWETRVERINRVDRINSKSWWLGKVYKSASFCSFNSHVWPSGNLSKLSLCELVETT